MTMTPLMIGAPNAVRIVPNVSTLLIVAPSARKNLNSVEQNVRACYDVPGIIPSTQIAMHSKKIQVQT